MTAVNALLIDGFNLIRRIYEAGKVDRKDEKFEDSHDPRAYPDSDYIKKTVLSSSASIKRALARHKPSHVCCVIDSHDKTWRHLLDSQYKADRKKTPAALLENLHSFEAAFEEFGVKSLKLENYEADDVIATLAQGIAIGKGNAVILSTDKSYLQLLGDHIRVFDHFNDCEINAEAVNRKFGVRVDQLVEFWALAGDRGNNIKGVERIGEKTARELLEEYGSLEAIMRSQPKDKRVERIRKEEAVALRCRKMLTLKTDVELGVNLKDFRFTRAN